MFDTSDFTPIGNSDWIREEGLDSLVDRVSCDTEKCQRPAKVYFRVQCCDHVTLQCATCMQKTIAGLKQALHHMQTITCKDCGASKDPRGFIGRPEEL